MVVPQGPQELLSLARAGFGKQSAAAVLRLRPFFVVSVVSTYLAVSGTPFISWMLCD